MSVSQLPASGRACRLLWHIGCQSRDPESRGLGADGFPLPIPLPGDPTRDIETPVYPTLVVCRVDKMRSHGDGSANDPLSLPDTTVPQAIPNRNRFWPPPVSCAMIGPDVVPRTDPGDHDRSPLSNSWTDGGMARTHQPFAPFGVLELKASPDLSGAAALEELNAGRCATCYYHVPMRAWNTITGPKVPTNGRRRIRSCDSEFGSLLAYVDSQLLPPTVPFSGAMRHNSGFMEDIRRVLTWQTGGGSFDGGRMETGVPESANPIRMPRGASAPDMVVQRNLVYGVPVRCLTAIGLLPPDEVGCRDFLNRLSRQLGLPKALGRRQLRRINNSSSSNKGRREAEPPQDSPEWSLELIMEIFFPLIDPSCWPRMGRKSLREMNRLPLREMAIARSDLRRIVAEFNATPSSSSAKSVREPLLQKLLAYECDEFERDGKSRANHCWSNRLVPAFMLPFLLMQVTSGGGVATCADGTDTVTALSCQSVYYGMVSLVRCPDHLLTDVCRAAAWHDARLLCLTMSLAWKSTRAIFAVTSKAMASRMRGEDILHEQYLELSRTVSDLQRRTVELEETGRDQDTGDGGPVRVRNIPRRGRKRKAAQRHLTLGLNRVRSRALNTDF